MVTCTGHIGIHEGADGRTDVRTYVRTLYVRTDVHDVMAIKPNFLTSMGYHNFLSMVLRAIFLASWSLSVSSLSRYSPTVFQPYSDLSAIRMSFCMASINKLNTFIQLSDTCVLFYTVDGIFGFTDHGLHLLVVFELLFVPFLL